MYATAHRVRTSQGAIGINAFLHEHGEAGQAINWSTASISRITDHDPGALVAQTTEIAPGGNAVLSFLDVVAPDGTSPGQVQAALQLQMGALLSGVLPTEARIQNITLRFGAVFGLQQGASIEYAELARHLLRVVSERPAPRWLGKEPIDIVAAPRTGAVSLSLAASSRERLEREGALQGAPRSVSVDDDDADAFQALHGDVLIHLVPLLTGLSLEGLAQIGGVRVRFVGREEVVWEWPRR